MQVGEDECQIAFIAPIAAQSAELVFWYRCVECDLSPVPRQILAVPFFLNIAPVLWMSGRRYRSAYLDPVLGAALERIRAAWRARDGEDRWTGWLESEGEEVAGGTAVDGDAVVTLFSGGVDSVATSLELADRPQSLVLIRGNDIELQNERSWSRVRETTARHAERIGARLYSMEANLLEFMDRNALDALLPGSRTWWGSVQHGMGLVGMMAVPCWLESTPRAVISATHSAGFAGDPWGSTPETDELIRWADVRVEHRGYTLTRQQKIAGIARFAAERDCRIDLRVCFRTPDGGNCGACEKCLRTASGLILEGCDPADFGLPVGTDDVVRRVRALIDRGRLRADANTIFHWKVLRERAEELGRLGNERDVPTMELVEVLRAADLERQARRWQRRERIKTVSDRVFRAVPQLERPVRALVRFMRRHVA